ncbi:hypothetical protein M1437_00290 [Patescibacteria group bacterium]|nr:hypothetical protein [Patescibacteria group bacterium]
MKKSTMAVAALLTALSSAPMVSVAYADDSTTPAATCTGCKGCKGCTGCKGCKGCKGCTGCKGCKGCAGCSGD